MAASKPQLRSVAAPKFGVVGVVDEPTPEVGESKILIPDEVEVDLALQIDKDPKLRFVLQYWEKNYKATLKRIDFLQETSTVNTKAELYQLLLGFYIVFQGGVFSAVALSSTLYCLSSWAPASLSLLVSAITVVSVHYRLTDYSRLKVVLQQEGTTAVDLRDQILELKNKGVEFDFSWLKGEYENRESRNSWRKFEGLKPRYYWLVVLPLVLFSLIILACCFFVLCGPGSRKLP